MKINRHSKFGKIAILTGGQSSEREVALATSKSIERALTELNIVYKVIMADGEFVSDLIAEKINTVFIAMHGGAGENGEIQGLLESLGLSYTGSGVLSSAICMNKDFSKKIFEYHGIATPKWQLLHDPEELKLELPIVIKPVTGGSTVATTIVRESAAVLHAVKQVLDLYNDSGESSADKIMAEEYIPGREITVGILDGQALPILEIESKTDFYDYEAKYSSGMSKHKHLTDISDSCYKEIQKKAEHAFKIAGCEGIGRVDFRLNGESYYILEINTIPGMTETSLLPEAAELVGIDFNTLVIRMLESAKKKA